MMNYEL